MLKIKVQSILPEEESLVDLIASIRAAALSPSKTLHYFLVLGTKK